VIRSASLVLLAFLLIFSTATLAHADVIRGRVLDPHDKPVARAQVLIISGGTVVVTATTGSDGRFGPLTVSAGDYDVVVAAPGLKAPAQRISVAATGDLDLTFALALAAVSESVVVSASTVDRPLSRVTDSVTVIDRTDLDARQIQTATEVLRSVPGFGLVANGGVGALTSVFPRGGESDYTLVLFDGVPLNMFGGGFDGAHLQTAGVDRIEVVRGPQSAVLGSGAIGGVVNVISRTGGPLQANGLFEGGSQDMSRLTAGASGSRQAWSWGASFERLASDGDTSYRESIGGPVSNDDYERLAGTASLGWSDRATRRVRVNARFGRDERGNPGPYGSDPYGLYPGLDTVSRGINHPRDVGGSAVFGDTKAVRHTVQAAWSDAPSLYISPYGDSDDRTRRLGGRYQADFDRGAAGYSAGVEITRERADNTYVTGTAFQPVPVARTLADVFGEGRWDLGDRAAVTAGARLDRIERSPIEADAYGSRPAFESDVVWSLNPKVSAAWFLRGTRSADAASGWTKIRGGAGTGIKPPTIFELAFTDNPSLKPERSRSMDVGIEHAFPRVLLVADATYFANRFDDLIVAVGDDFSTASRYRTDNIANASAKGVEVGVRWQSRFGLSLRGAYTYLDTEVLGVDTVANEAPAPFAVGDPLVRRPRHQGSFDARYARGRAQLFLAVNGRGATTDFEPNYAVAVLTNPGFVTCDAGGSVALARGLEAYARVTNLANRVYEEALGYPAPGRLAMVGLRVAVGR
jgi:outer membrane cobalamin receptor